MLAHASYTFDLVAALGRQSWLAATHSVIFFPHACGSRGWHPLHCNLQSPGARRLAREPVVRSVLRDGRQVLQGQLQLFCLACT
jgi:hypothetical protein